MEAGATVCLYLSFCCYCIAEMLLTCVLSVMAAATGESSPIPIQVPQCGLPRCLSVYCCSTFFLFQITGRMCITVSANTHTHTAIFFSLLFPFRRGRTADWTPSSSSSSSFPAGEMVTTSSSHPIHQKPLPPPPPPPFLHHVRGRSESGGRCYSFHRAQVSQLPLVLRWKGREGAAAADGIPPSPPQQVAFKSLFRCCSLATFLPPPPPLSSAEEEEEEEEEKRDPSLGSEQVPFLWYVIRQFIAILIGTVAPRRSLKGGAIGLFFIN